MVSDAKEFEGRSIDEAIDKACTHFDVDREALEVEIINDASGGIFGLVGGRKATVRAMLRDQSVELKLYVRDVLNKLIEPIAGRPSLDVSMEGPGKVLVVIEDEEQAGLLIGKEGVTLQALQYIANRILAKQWSEQVRLRLDAGDYRERQNESLREMALSLAEKAVSQNRSQSTRPLSSYHRRVVHMALQEDATVQTRSKGDGPMKRVIIQPAKSNGSDAANGSKSEDNDAKAEKAPKPEKAAKSGNGSRPRRAAKSGNGSKPPKAAKPAKNGNVAEAAPEVDATVAADAANGAPAKDESGKNGRSRSRGSRGGRSRSSRGRGRSRKPVASDASEQSPMESAPEQPVASDASIEPSPAAAAPEQSAEPKAPKQPAEPKTPEQPAEAKAPKQLDAAEPSSGQPDVE